MIDREVEGDRERERERERERLTILDKVGACPFFPARERERGRLPLASVRERGRERVTRHARIVRDGYSALRERAREK